MEALPNSLEFVEKLHLLSDTASRAWGSAVCGRTGVSVVIAVHKGGEEAQTRINFTSWLRVNTVFALGHVLSFTLQGGD